MNLTLLAEELERDEGIRLNPHMDTKGRLTIGIGRNLDDNPLTADEREYVGHDGGTEPITREQALFLLSSDIRRIGQELDRVMPWWRNLDEIRKRVLLNMAFNLGVQRLLKFTETLRWVKQEHYSAAACCILQSVWANQVGKRADRLAEMMRTGEVPGCSN